MFGLNFIEVLVIGLVVLVLFGNRLPQVLGDLGKGVKAFKEGMDGEAAPKPAAPKATPKALAKKKKPAARKAK
jgi:sec-independent protein translocase protein TatA